MCHVLAGKFKRSLNQSEKFDFSKDPTFMVKKNVGSNSMFSYIFLLYIKYHLHKGLAFCNDIALAILHLNREKKQ